jgi:hypothetical protein
LAIYFVKAKPKNTDLLTELDKRIKAREILKMRPFGNALHCSLENAKFYSRNNDNDKYAV